MLNHISFKIVVLFAMFHSLSASAQFVDTETAADVKPANSSLSGSWKLDFSDEFNGTTVNTAKWNIDNSTRSRAARPNIGINDWRWKPTNVSVSNGNLVLQVYKTGTNSMTNGSINSSGKYETMYGYFEARIKIGEAAKGTHTAFWLQGPGQGLIDGTANDGAEIDVFESAWTDDYTKSVVHIDGYGTSHQASTKQYNTPGIHDGFHVWGFHWTSEFMDIYYDGVKKVRYGSESDYKWVVRALEFLWLSNGASFGLSGNQYFIDRPIGYLTETHVDYMRVWKEDANVPTNGNYVSNGDFSLSNAWIKGDNMTDILIPENTAGNEVSDAGAFYCRMPSLSSSRFIYQDIIWNAGGNFEFGFKGRIQNAVGPSGSQPNNRTATEPFGVATLTGEVFAFNTNGVLSTTPIAQVTTQSNTNVSLRVPVQLPANTNKIRIKISKNWNVSYVDDVYISTTTALSSAKLESIKIHKLGTDLLVSSEKELSMVKIFDCMGKVVYQFNCKRALKCKIPLLNLYSGIYIVSVVDVNQIVATQKFIQY